MSEIRNSRRNDRDERDFRCDDRRDQGEKLRPDEKISTSTSKDRGREQRNRSRDRSDKLDDDRKERRRNESSKKKKRKRSDSSESSDDDEDEKKKRRRRKHRRDSRSESKDSDDDDDDGDSKLDQRLAKERERQKEERRRRKEVMKAKETPEEKRARRLAKKLSKEQKKKEEMGWGDEFMGYSNVDNPFGDRELTNQFVWEKKYEKAGVKNIDLRQLERERREKLVTNQQELERIRRGRDEREAMKAEWELMQRENENKLFVEWSKQEDQFHLQQARMRSRIRIQESRAKPIDLLASYLNADEENEDLDIGMHEPYAYLNGLTIRDLEDLLEDIRVYKKLSGGGNDDYWNDLAVIAEDELEKLKKYDPSSTEYVGDRREGIHSSVRKDVAGLLKSKSHNELALLETEILKKIKSGEEGIDIGYWESLLGQLKAHMARARLRQRHQATLKSKLQKLRQQQIAEVKETVDVDEAGPSTSATSATKPSTNQPEPEPDTSGLWVDMDQEEKRELMIDAYEKGRYSPSYVAEDAVPPGTEIIDVSEDMRRLEFARNQCRATGRATAEKDSKLEDEARKGMSNDEATFAVEEPLEQKTYLWSDKYRPRKPRYFNRVHTGFEWNKYNQTHYDLDNPPPKIVQGYKFNIFYPDLLDTTKAPEFQVLPCTDTSDFAILKFHAGPPYEDIAFKIVNREWEVSHKRGYRCQFQNGIFQLWFHFKKYRYRR